MLKITMIIVMTFFAIFITPQERAHAIGPILAAEGAFVGGAGIYVGGALLVGAIAGIAGCESCQADIEAHAETTWNGATQLAKDSMQAMIDASVGAGSSLTATDANFNTWMDSQIQGITNRALGLLSSTYANVTIDSTNLNYYSSSQKEGAIKNKLAHSFLYQGLLYEATIVNIDSEWMRILVLTKDASNTTGPSVLEFKVTAAGNNALYWQMRNEYNAIANISMYIAYISKFAGVQVVTDSNYKSVKASVVANVDATWRDMKDAGLVLPTDNAIPMYNNKPVTYNPDTDSYAGIDGVTVPRDGITYDYQKPHWKTHEDLVALGGAAAGLGAGLYIDGWAGSDSVTSTYNPTTDATTTTTSGTTTNVTTGETAVTSTTTTTTGDTTTLPPKTPEGTTPKTQTGKSNRWGKLVTTKFPFSLPWDLFFILSFLNADPKTPVFSIDERINKRENVEGIQIKFDIDLSFLDPYVPWFRRFIVLGFALFLILNTRKLLGGAQ